MIKNKKIELNNLSSIESFDNLLKTTVSFSRISPRHSKSNFMLNL